MAIRHSEAIGNVSGTALEIDMGPSRNPRGVLEFVRVQNRDPSDAWINLYAAAASDVTPGADRHGSPFHVPASAEVLIPMDVLFSVQILSIFASTSADGTGAPSTGLRADASFIRVS